MESVSAGFLEGDVRSGAKSRKQRTASGISKAKTGKMIKNERRVGNYGEEELGNMYRSTKYLRMMTPPNV